MDGVAGGELEKVKTERMGVFLEYEMMGRKDAETI